MEMAALRRLTKERGTKKNYCLQSRKTHLTLQHYAEYSRDSTLCRHAHRAMCFQQLLLCQLCRMLCIYANLSYDQPTIQCILSMLSLTRHCLHFPIKRHFFSGVYSDNNQTQPPPSPPHILQHLWQHPTRCSLRTKHCMRMCANSKINAIRSK